MGEEGAGVETACPVCERVVGDHLMREWFACVKETEYILPYEEVPGGPLMLPGTDGYMVSAFTIGGGWVEDGFNQRYPLLRLQFASPGAEPMSSKMLPPVNLVMDADGLKRFRQMVATAVDQAIQAARRGRQ